uniref:Uncharacterized protein n=1 Tax=viral metagenome TaxID=1070528 RepID=A0A6C0BYP0_9ZZZZ
MGTGGLGDSSPKLATTAHVKLHASTWYSVCAFLMVKQSVSVLCKWTWETVLLMRNIRNSKMCTRPT